MSSGRGEGPAAAIALCALAIGLAGDARADEALARRLAALRWLADPFAARARTLPVPEAPDFACARVAWWTTGEDAVRARVEEAVRDAALRHLVSEDLIRSVIRAESAYDARAVSHAGAMGLMQLMPATARALGVVCPFDPRENVLAGTAYLRRMRDRFGSWRRALAAYNAGPDAVEAGRLPEETRAYVERVLRGWLAADSELPAARGVRR